MAHFAKVENGIVTQVIVAEQSVIDTGLFGAGWVQTSYRTLANQHPEGRPLRKNYAGIGFAYDAQRDAFIPPKDYPSWVLNEETCTWNAPVAKPDDGKLYKWEEETTSWVETQPLPEPTIPSAEELAAIQAAQLEAQFVNQTQTSQIVAIQTEQISSLQTDQISSLTVTDVNGGV